MVIGREWWLRRDVVVVTGSRPSLPESKKTVAGSHAVTHYALVIGSGGGVKNIAGAADMPLVTAKDDQDQDVQLGLYQTDDAIVGPDVEDVERFEGQRSPFNVNALEAIGLTFALEVPRVALLVLPASAGVRRAVYELRLLGVNAHGLDGNATLLVSTVACTRSYGRTCGEVWEAVCR
ncbi:hypothetical protein BXZ70DRAFT_787300 [Cristinia sonorae]|uniref:Uncharacterized protein n=1 Tax=Cristinia sonorae TaxID=1940300 RepID=A0A8K0XRF2_9AGAR|nr:hypothetical protein BXZ70DRAFT_787300 [Cristinia sonorae]